MDKDRIYAALRKITPKYLWIRPTTRYIMNNYKNIDLVSVEISVDYGINVKIC